LPTGRFLDRYGAASGAAILTLQVPVLILVGQFFETTLAVTLSRFCWYSGDPSI
jgi:hypothetical protein